MSGNEEEDGDTIEDDEEVRNARAEARTFRAEFRQEFGRSVDKLHLEGRKKIIRHWEDKGTADGLYRRGQAYKRKRDNEDQEYEDRIKRRRSMWEDNWGESRLEDEDPG